MKLRLNIVDSNNNGKTLVKQTERYNSLEEFQDAAFECLSKVDADNFYLEDVKITDARPKGIMVRFSIRKEYSPDNKSHSLGFAVYYISARDVFTILLDIL